MLSLRGNVFSAEISHDTRTIKQAIKGGNIEKKEKETSNKRCTED